jgi:hypothetical protein
MNEYYSGMKRRWNWRLWAGFLVVLAGAAGYMTLFAWYPITRDFPWASLLMFAGGAVLLALGLTRSFREPQLYRGKIFGSILIVLGLAVVAFFCYGLLYKGRQMPPSASAPRVGQKAPDFMLPDQNGNPVSLAQLLSGTGGGKAKGAVLIFYRGYW